MASVVILRQNGAVVGKIQAIKLVRSVTNLGLKEAKDMVELLPGTFEVSEVPRPGMTPAVTYTPEAVVRELIACGYDAEIVGGTGKGEQDVEQTFKTFLIALINQGEYDQVVTFIKTKKHGTVMGGPTRNLEPM